LPVDGLAAAIDRLYAAFAAVPRPAEIEYCPCCFTADEESALLASAELRQLPVDVLRPYAANVMLTVGGVDDLRYFTPRILEIACTVGFNWPDLEPIAGRLRMAGWRHWPSDQPHAVRGALQTLWSTTLATFPVTPDIDTVLCALGNAEDDLDPYLTMWSAALRHPPAAEHLRDLLSNGVRWNRRTMDWRLANAFWDGRDGRVLGWLAGAGIRHAVAEAFACADTEKALQTLADVDDLLRRTGP
jgi:hypothetical protein